MDENGERIDIEVDYPQTVYLVEGNHPEVFSANGSHGTWASEGTFREHQMMTTHSEWVISNSHSIPILWLINE